MTDPLARIAAALDRLSPPPPAYADPLAHPAYVWRQGALVAARDFSPLPLAMLHGIEQQKAALRANLERLAAGHAAQDVLLWGARGTGKSAVVKSTIAAVQAAGGTLALVEAPGDGLDGLSALFDAIAPVKRAFALFIDSLNS